MFIKENDNDQKSEREKERICNSVKKIAWYVLAEMSGGFSAQELLEDEDFKDALENPEAFEIPENDIKFLKSIGLKEEEIKNNTKGRRTK